jgi:hypothetical protein
MENYCIPNYIKEYNIYDVFYNDNGELILILPSEGPPPNIKYMDEGKSFDFKVCVCPHNHTYIYSLRTEYKKNIDLRIFNKSIVTYVNKYPKFEDEIIMSTIVKHEDDYIPSWIEFHKNIGVSRFIIYDNSDTYELGKRLKPYILNNIVVLLKWSYPYRLPISGISGQTTQQNHSIYAFQTSKYIGLFDVDEYINLQMHKTLPEFFEDYINNNAIQVKQISSFRFLNKFFFNPHRLPSDPPKFFNVFNCYPITKEGYEKNFVIAKNVNTFSVHMVTDGLPMHTVDEKIAFFNHYFFLNKTDRGFHPVPLLDWSILAHV